MLNFDIKQFIKKNISTLYRNYYTAILFAQNSNSFSYVLCNTRTELKFPKKKSCKGQRCFSYRGAQCGATFLIKLSRHLLCIHSTKYLVNPIYIYVLFVILLYLYFRTRFLKLMVFYFYIRFM